MSSLSSRSTNTPCTSTVSCLNRSRCPAAVRGPTIRLALITLTAGIVPVVVDAVDGKARRINPHIGKEIKECVPSTAHADSSFAVVMKGLVARIVAAIKQCLPCLMRGRVAELVNGICFVPGNRHFPIQASTTSCATASEVADVDNSLVSAFTPASPSTAAGLQTSKGNYCKSSKHLTCSVLEFRTSGNRVCVSHSGSLRLWSGPQRGEYTSAGRFILHAATGGA